MEPLDHAESPHFALRKSGNEPPKQKGAPQGAPFALLDGDTGGANAARDYSE
jgi:hypothetical protein